MIPRRLPIRPAHLARSIRPVVARTQLRNASDSRLDPAVADPGMNGGYVNPPRIKRQHRDPYAGWWDPQERKNFGEPVHEDNDILAVFSTEEYTHASPAKAWASIGAFVAVMFGLLAAVYEFYPDLPSAPRTFPDGLDKELGGEGALHARKHGDDEI